MCRCVTTTLWLVTELAAAALTEYCQWEKFNASCPGKDDVILMLTGRYGRMRFGRCMREDHGSVGCSADVLSYLDRQCSGRRHCQLSVPDAVLHAMHRCPKEIMSYLEASYVCVTGNHIALYLYRGSLLCKYQPVYCSVQIRAVLARW